MKHQPIQVTFLQPLAPQLAYAVPHLTPTLEDRLDETSIRLESAVAIMQRTVSNNSSQALTLEAETWPWEEVMGMIEAAQVARDEAPDGAPLREAAHITLQFLANYIGELQEAQTGERHIFSLE